MDHDCRKYFEYVSEFLDGELPAPLMEKIKSHLYECPECQDCLDSLRKTINLCKNMPKSEISPGFRKKLIGKLKEQFDSK